MSKYHFLFLKAALLSLFFQGWVIASLRLMGIDLPFSIGTPITYFLFTFLWLFILTKKSGLSGSGVRVFSILWLVLSLFICKLLIGVVSYGGFYLKTIILFALPFSMYLSLLLISKSQYYSFVVFFKRLIWITILISVVQFVFETYLPNALVRLPLINLSGVVYHTQSYIGSMSYTKPNGLVAANSIEYSFILLCFMFFVLHINRSKSYILVLLIFLLIFLNASRFSTILSLILIYFYMRKNISFAKRNITITIILIACTCFFYIMWDKLQYILFRLAFMGGGAESDSERLKDFLLGVEYLKEYWALGVPPEIMVNLNRILTDGALMLIVLDFGIFVSVVFLGFLMLLPKISGLPNIKLDNLHIFIAVTFGSMLINSVILSKIVFPLYLTLVALVVLKEKNERCYAT
ncbi:hypothetical protein DLH98_25855 [Vibrio parahaemolyticus]|uniref:Polysaccharide polymerase n=6 Tax=Vibrio parahaemolyticus TaxID=670 RepID=A0A5P5X580_VIBPH|nr:hypothetical protein [Vibrio parahaemolyticus]EGQ8033681.1 hypothetical protein [Vibrio parahaemolyticus]EGQ8924826.1 hypothetical protein [Vibrio parahaemolyticus]EGR2858888.1 hypothetical protein [Vibrio parahaemolyticus]EGR2948676.1 hypothetical protein [Vibrio parahaemolyticus]EHH1037836.1 hypothetical protein [Vibrio parahaemolyticus]